MGEGAGDSVAVCVTVTVWPTVEDTATVEVVHVGLVGHGTWGGAREPLWRSAANRPMKVAAMMRNWGVAHAKER